MKLNRTWAMVVAIVMALTLSLSGTLAYLQDTDEAVNVMTLGNVQIEQLEYQRAKNVAHNATATEGSLVPFVQGKPLYPAVPKAGATNPYTAEPTDLFSWGPYVTAEGAGNGLWNDEKISNVVDKFVFVKNTGKSDAYYRTLFAFECPEGMEYGEGSDKEFMMNVNGNVRFDWANHGYITVKGVRYLLMSATYNEILTPGEISRPSLLQVLMTEHCTNEHMELLGDSYEILVVTQAVQAAGFDSAATALNQAFGEVSTTSHPWVNLNGTEEGDQDPDDFYWPILGGNTEGLEATMFEGGAARLEADMAADAFEVADDVEVTLDLNGNTLSGILTNNGDLTVDGGAVNGNFFRNNGTAAISNTTMATGTTGDYSNISFGADAVTTYDNVDITAGGGGVAAADGAAVTFNSGSVYVDTASTSGRYLFYTEGAGSSITINDGKFSWDTSDNQKRAYVYAGAGTTVKINGGTFGKASTRSGYTDGIMGEGTVIIKGGTFGFNPTKWVADGYVANYDETAKTWTVVAK